MGRPGGQEQPVNLSSIRDRVRALSGIKLQTLRSDEQIDIVINESYQESLGMMAWPFLRASEQVLLVEGNDSFSTPTAFSEVSSVSFSDNFGHAVRMSPTTVDEIDRLDSEEGEPIYYARVNDRDFVVWPTPNKNVTLTLKGKKKEENLQSDSSSPVYDEQFHPMLAYRTAAKILAEEGDDSGRSELYQAEANVLFLRMQQYYIRSGDVGMFVMGGRRRRNIDAY
jgi:hypothetical protein